MRLTECSFNVTPNADGSCLTNDHVNIITKYTGSKTISDLKKETNCTTDTCIVETINLPTKVKDKIVREALKSPAESLHGNYWLNNTELDTCMSQLRIHYPGFAHSFIHMSDLKTFPPSNLHSFDYKVFQVDQINFGECFAKALRREPPCSTMSTYNNVPLKSFGIIFNTDTSDGSGQHWFPVYISMDTRDLQTGKPMIVIEVFNSGGTPIRSKAFQTFWEQKKVEIAKATGCKCEYKSLVSTVRHQRDDTGNCGSYSLFYMYCRLKGIRAEEFNVPGKIVSDEKMEQFRHILFTKKSK